MSRFTRTKQLSYHNSQGQLTCYKIQVLMIKSVDDFMPRLTYDRPRHWHPAPFSPCLSSHTFDPVETIE